jgi:outer membrane protein TolC
VKLFHTTLLFERVPLTAGMLVTGALLFAQAGCRSPAAYRQQADQTAYGIVERSQQKVLQKTEPFTIEPAADTLRRKLLLNQDLPHAGPAALGSDHLPPIPHWPDTGAPENTNSPAAMPNITSLSLTDALQIAARNNRDYQTRKEDVFREALALDLEANQFRSLLAGEVGSEFEANYRGEDNIRGIANKGSLSWKRRLKYGTLLTTHFAVDLVKLLTLDRSSSLGMMADATITIPLLRGAGRHIVAEPLTQAEQNLVYALFNFERYKQTLSARVATEYMSVIQQLDQVDNAEDNYRRLAAASERAQRLADAGRLPQIQVDQSVQDELRAHDRLTTARQAYAGRLDNFKITLGLPVDAEIELDRDELQQLARMTGLVSEEQNRNKEADAPDSDADTTRGPLELDTRHAIQIALEHRLDMRTALGRVYDAQRHAVVAADALRMGLTINGSGAIGESRSLTSADMPDARLRFDEGVYSAGLNLDLPLERTTERNAWRNSLIALERAVRDTQNLEDQIKLEVRNSLREMLQARESYRIQKRALSVAERRVDSTELFLEAGRAQVRDILDAQEALVSARNSLTAAIVNYRAAEIKLQRDMGVLVVNADGHWEEYIPDGHQPVMDEDDDE